MVNLIICKMRQFFICFAMTMYTTINLMPQILGIAFKVLISTGQTFTVVLIERQNTVCIKMKTKAVVVWVLTECDVDYVCRDDHFS